MKRGKTKPRTREHSTAAARGFVKGSLSVRPLFADGRCFIYRSYKVGQWLRTELWATLEGRMQITRVTSYRIVGRRIEYIDRNMRGGRTYRRTVEVKREGVWPIGFRYYFIECRDPNAPHGRTRFTAESTARQDSPHKPPYLFDTIHTGGAPEALATEWKTQVGASYVDTCATELLIFELEREAGVPVAKFGTKPR